MIVHLHSEKLGPTSAYPWHLRYVRFIWHGTHLSVSVSTSRSEATRSYFPCYQHWLLHSPFAYIALSLWQQPFLQSPLRHQHLSSASSIASAYKHCAQLMHYGTVTTANAAAAQLTKLRPTMEEVMKLCDIERNNWRHKCSAWPTGTDFKMSFVAFSVVSRAFAVSIADDSAALLESWCLSRSRGPCVHLKGKMDQVESITLTGVGNLVCAWMSAAGGRRWKTVQKVKLTRILYQEKWQAVVRRFSW